MTAKNIRDGYLSNAQEVNAKTRIPIEMFYECHEWMGVYKGDKTGPGLT